MQTGLFRCILYLRNKNENKDKIKVGAYDMQIKAEKLIQQQRL